MTQFLFGVNVALCAIAAVMFLKFWKSTRDRLFLLFAIAFWLLGINWLVLATLGYFIQNPSEHNALVYSIRLFAFVLILAAIIGKNRGSQNSSGVKPNS